MEVVGISRTLVEALVDKVKSAMKEEAEQWQTLQRDTVFIKDEFEMMKSFLNTADEEDMKNQVTRTWVGQAPWKARVLALDRAVAEMKLLKARAEDVNQRNLRYNPIGNLREQMTKNSAGSASQRTSDMFIKPRHGFDKHNGILDLTRLITTEDKGLGVVSVCGTEGDLGIVSIIKKVYDDPKVHANFHCRTWVKLMGPFNPQEFIRALAGSFCNNVYPQPQEQGASVTVSSTVLTSMKAMPPYSVISEYCSKTNTDFMESLKRKTYLIVLEDLSSVAEWNAIRAFLPDLNNGSRIIVSTKQPEIASLCTGQPCQVSLLQKFSEDQSVYAFFTDQVMRWAISKLQLQGTAPRPLGKNDSCPLVAHEPEANKLIEQINLALTSEAHRVVSVCGIAGVGKSFLVKTLFNDPQSPAWKFMMNGWVNAPHPFDIVDMCMSIYGFTSDGRIEHYPPAEGEDIVLSWWDLLELRQWLLVIDDLGSMENWDVIKANLISRATKSCIIVITRDESVARHCATSDDAVCILKGLEADKAHCLFDEVVKDLRQKNKATKDAGTSNPDPNMMEDASFIINKCGRLPKLIVALANCFDKAPNILQEMRLNANFMYELKTNKGLDSFRNVFTTIYSSYQTCPHRLKKCIFYLSLFTQSTIIRRSRLVRRWIAESYCEGLDSNSKVEYTEKLLGNIATLGIIDKPPQTSSSVAGCMRGTACHVNSLFLDYIISQETKENIFLPLEVTVLQGQCSLNIQRAGQHLAIGSSWKGDKFVLDSLDFSRLRSLTVVREWRSFFISHRMRVLRVLDLEETNVNDNDVEQMLVHLLCLKFLSLRRCTKVSRLPESLGGLNQLQTLDIRHTYIDKVPVGISKLLQLQYIRAGTSVALMDEEPSTTRRSRYGHVSACDGVKVPKRTGALVSLHTLGVINVSTIGGKNIQLFKNLTQLRKLGVSGINRRNIKGFLSAIEGHVHLESLSLQLHMDEDLEWLDKFTTPRNLQRLKMKVHVEKFQHWSCLKVLGQIRRLQVLCLHLKADQDVELQFCDTLDGAAWSTPNQFCELKVLEIACSSSLQVKFADRDMKLLEQLKVRSLDGSSLNFSGLKHTSSLKHVWLKGSFDDTLKQELLQKIAQHPNRPTPKMDEPRSS
ncbi:disease resistance protein Pik-2-like isoform X4 [Miscanthus floridulus]|uniref:disease resistance protein Pik-2-like isoform X4 n=1 Tax=Miscanthus floridulus TaxID=154761 RepID=UPI00345B4BF1